VLVEALRGELFDAQREFVESESLCAAACCTRRAGKSYACAVSLISRALALNAGNLLYIALTRQHAKNIMRPIIRRLLRKYSIKIVESIADLCFQFENGSQIWLTGAGDSAADVEKLLGIPLDWVVVDEGQSFPEHIRYLLYDVLLITMAERSGKIRLIGTPSLIPKGFFYDVVTGAEKTLEWSIHSWSWQDNTHIASAIQAQVDGMIRTNPCLPQTPSFRRNYLGEWVADLDDLVYKLQPHTVVSTQAVLEARCDTFVLGVDLGFRDAAAFVVVGWNRRVSDTAYVVYATSQSGMIPSEIAKRIEGLQKEYSTIRTVVDEGGLGKSIAEEWRRRYMLNVHPAQKRDKRLFIEEVNGSLILGKLKISEDASSLVDEMRELVWLDSDRKAENPACENHNCDAALYAFREARAYLYTPDKAKPDPMKVMEDAFLKHATQQYNRRNADVFTDFD
jgi:hypothetical protein